MMSLLVASSFGMARYTVMSRRAMLASSTAIAASLSSAAGPAGASPAATSVTDSFVVNGQRQSAMRYVEADVGMKFQRTELTERLFAQAWPAEWPFPPAAFSRMDESDDASFYAAPRFVYHVDEVRAAAARRAQAAPQLAI